MNCKEGDLAIVIGRSEHAGRIVEVLYAAPPHGFSLPDGYGHIGAPPYSWVIEFLSGTAQARTVNNNIRETKYGVGLDSKLRPLPGEVEEKVTEEEITA